MNIETLLKPLDYGFHELSSYEYGKIPALNNSSLKLGKISPLHIDCSLDQKYVHEDKKHFTVGTAYHYLIFEPDLFKQKYVFFDRSKMPFPSSDFRKKENKEWKKDLEEQAEEEGKKLLDIEEYEIFMQMREGLFLNKDVARLVEESGKMEYTMIWKHPVFEINCKARIDKLIPNKAILDLKTIQICSDDEFSKQWEKYSYKYQAGFYHEGYSTLIQQEIPFIFIIQEKNYPYYAKAKLISDERLKKSREEYYKHIENYIAYKTGNLPNEGIEVF